MTVSAVVIPVVQTMVMSIVSTLVVTCNIEEITVIFSQVHKEISFVKLKAKIVSIYHFSFVMFTLRFRLINTCKTLKIIYYPAQQNMDLLSLSKC